MRLRTLVLLTAVGMGGMLAAQSAEAQDRGRSGYRGSRPAPRSYGSRSYNYRSYSNRSYRSYRPYSYAYNYGYRYSYAPYYYDPYYYDPYYYDPYYYAPRPVFRSYRPYYRPRVGVSLRLGW
jgi:hypothetical protein